MMKNIIFLIVLCLTFTTKSAFPQSAKTKAHKNIQLLKNGALFVRLKTSELKINALIQRGRNEEAEEIRINQEIENKSIVKAFKSYFDFCPVYFFYSNHSTDIKNGNYKGYLLNVDFQIDTTFTSNDFLIGEYDESETTHLDAFIIKDKNFAQLNSPFPFLIKQNKMLVSTRSKEEIVILLNTRFHEFFSYAKSK